MSRPLHRAHPALTGGPRCRPYRHTGYLTPTGLCVSLSFAAAVPAALVAASTPVLAGVAALLLGLAVAARVDRPSRRA